MNRANGRIVNAYATNFEALKDSGFVYVEIENTGEINSEFSVSVLRSSLGCESTVGIAGTVCGRLSPGVHHPMQ